jgi:hypothetical protein
LSKLEKDRSAFKIKVVLLLSDQFKCASRYWAYTKRWLRHNSRFLVKNKITVVFLRNAIWEAGKCGKNRELRQKSQFFEEF